ncbi:MAG: hypothetical protein RLZZ196_3237 [Bacteroidota bacterium]|jgi:hypothetical protein
MTTVAVYHSSVPNAKSQEKIDLLRFFSQGAKACGDPIQDVYDYNARVTDVGVIQGWLGPGTPAARHLELRNRVITQQLKFKKHVIAVDSNLFLYANTANPLHYLRYSFDGVFPNTGIYCDTEIDPTRWQKISRDLNLSLKDYRTQGDHILICLQRNGGWSMGEVDVQDWVTQTIDTLRQYTDRPFVIRAHPGDKAAREYLNPKSPKCKIKFSKRVSLSIEENLIDDLKGCWAAVNYNSSPVVGAAIEGVPIFVMDPAKSQCAEIANTDLSQIENPQLPDRQKWVERLSMFHWNFDELKSGECWQHMRKFI